MDGTAPPGFFGSLDLIKSFLTGDRCLRTQLWLTHDLLTGTASFLNLYKLLSWKQLPRCL